MRMRMRQGQRVRRNKNFAGTATDFYECMAIHRRINRPSVPVQGICKWKFLVRYFCAPSGLRQGQVFTPPPPPWHPLPVHLRGECPPRVCVCLCVEARMSLPYAASQEYSFCACAVLGIIALFRRNTLFAVGSDFIPSTYFFAQFHWR